MEQFRRIRRFTRQLIAPVTALGWTVLTLGLAMWAVGAWLNWREAFIVAAICLVLFSFGVVSTLGRLAIDAEVSVSPSRVVVGDRAAGQLMIVNKRSRTTYGLRIELPVGRAVATFEIPRLRGGQVTDELFVVPTQRRAIIDCGPVTSVKGDPIGLMRRVHQWSDVHSIYVHPKTTALSTIAAGQIRDLEGQATGIVSSSDIAFHTLREYDRGDDLRHVHWKTSAKLGTLMVRQYNDTRRSHVAVVLSIDPDDYADEDEFELGVSCAASVAVQAIRDGQTLTVVVGDSVIPSTDTVSLLDHFSAIEGVPGRGSVPVAVMTTRRYAPGASVAVISTGSRPTIADLRRNIARAGLDMPNVVLRSDVASHSAYRAIGDTTIVNVPALHLLRPGLAAVSS